MTCDVFLRSYAKDLPWVPWALRSLDRFVTGVRNIIVSVPSEDFERFKALNLVREQLWASRIATDSMDPYLGQQADKLISYVYTDADCIMFWDSDVLAIRPFGPSDLMLDGKPRCLMTPYSKLVNADGSQATPWMEITSKALGHPVAWEYMRAHPMMSPRIALAGFRDYMETVHNMGLLEYISRQPNRAFSEFNCLHGWAHYHRPDLYSWHDTETLGVPEPFVRQFWSWSGLTDAERAEMEKILA